MEDPKLEAYFQFDQSDLQANRDGQFSERQRTRLAENDRRIQRRWGLRSIPFLLIAALGPVLAFGPGDFFDWSWKFLWGVVWTGIWGAIGLVMLGSFLSKPKQMVLARASGKVNIAPDRTYRSALRLHIGRHAFDALDDIADVMMQGDEYIVYYERDWEEIVSAERVVEAK